ncbi:unnamed protein product [Kuraishia capsulata CBS 1993]|uniref:VASt domain-containing protein n=1 Tax=Kuraishia capsulata CBS 1993 TaxID=1382522 RepID=W6MRI1_9ASCO|nr:uncharacterized protein KUCA_T00005307001 [Kuraishia capsulata CBS 1993]CDK29319.1 unnamed protein product [Kuraishia capsulata CBS 1993]
MKFLHVKQGTEGEQSSLSTQTSHGQNKLKRLFSMGSSDSVLHSHGSPSIKTKRKPSILPTNSNHKSEGLTPNKADELGLPEISSVKSRSKSRQRPTKTAKSDMASVNEDSSNISMAPVKLTEDSFPSAPPYVTKKILTDVTTGDETSTLGHAISNKVDKIESITLSPETLRKGDEQDLEDLSADEDNNKTEGFLNTIITALHSMRSHSDVNSIDHDADKDSAEKRKNLNDILKDLRNSGATQQQSQLLINEIEKQQRSQQSELISPSFVPLKQAPLTTMGKGNLNLSFFDKGSETNSRQHLLEDLTSTSTPRKNLSFTILDSKGSERNLSPRGRMERNPSTDKRKNSRNPVSASTRTALDATKSGSDSKDTNGAGNLNGETDENAKLKRPRNSFRSSKGPPTLTDNTDNGEEESTSVTNGVVPSLAGADTPIPDEKHQAEFHQLFKNIPSSEKLVGDYVCAMRKKVLIQGRLYISESHVNFRSNLVGFVTNMSIPAGKIVQIVRKNTAGVIPNAIEIRTLHDRYGFASFVNRDSAFEMLTNVWDKALHGSERRTDVRISLNDFSDDEDEYDFSSDEESVSNNNHSRSGLLLDSDDNSDDDQSVSDQSNMTRSDAEEKDISGANGSTGGDSFNGIPMVGPRTHAVTDNGHQKEAGEIEVADDVISAPLGVVASLLLGDDTSFAKQILVAQKNFAISDIPPFSGTLKKRSYSYTKPLGGPIGPKQTVCKIEESIEKYDLNGCVISIQSTQTPDVPSGNSFKVRTKTYLSWAPQNRTRVYVVTMCVWSGRSLIKGAVEKGTISGQKESMEILLKELKSKVASGSAMGRSGSSQKKRRTKSSSKSLTEPKQVEVVPSEPVQTGWLDILFSTTGIQIAICITLVVSVYLVFLHRPAGPKTGFGPPSNRPEYFSRTTFSSDNYLRDKSEYEIWDWIEKRNGDSDSAFVNSNAPGTPSEFRKKHSNQQLKEMITLLQERLAKLQQDME